MPIQWSEQYLLGIDAVDKQHMGIFEIVHRFYEECLTSEGEKTVADTLAFLKTYTEDHFRAEEALMEEHKYPRLEEHKGLHAAFLDRFGELVHELNSVGPSQELADDTADMVQNWLVDHITQQDRQYAPYIT